MRLAPKRYAAAGWMLLTLGALVSSVVWAQVPATSDGWRAVQRVEPALPAPESLPRVEAAEPLDAPTAASPLQPSYVTPAGGPSAAADEGRVRLTAGYDAAPGDPPLPPQFDQTPGPAPVAPQGEQAAAQACSSCDECCCECAPPWYNVAGRMRYHWNNHTKPCLQESHWGYASEFCRPPLGASIDAHIGAQVASGTAARMVLYHYDFIDGTAILKPRGKEELARIAELLPKNFFPVIIETTPGAAELDQARRHAVLVELGQQPFPVPDERVVAALPPTQGIVGVQAILIQQNLLRQTASGIGFTNVPQNSSGSYSPTTQNPVTGSVIPPSQ